jgi:hypothetical protein
MNGVNPGLMALQFDEVEDGLIVFPGYTYPGDELYPHETAALFVYPCGGVLLPV